MILPHGRESSIFLCCSEFFPLAFCILMIFLYHSRSATSLLFYHYFLFWHLVVFCCAAAPGLFTETRLPHSVLLAAPHGVNAAQLRYPVLLGAGLVCCTWPSRKWTRLGKWPDGCEVTAVVTLGCV